MEDWFVGPVMERLINACSDYLQDQLRWQRGMKEELERLRENHPKIQAVVSAYTQAHIRDRNPALSSWIWQLRDAIDDVNDLLDDFEYMKLEEQLTRRNVEGTKVRSATTNFFFETARKLRKVGERALKMDPNLRRLEEVVQKLDRVSADVSTYLPLLENAKQEQQEQELQLYKTRETGSLPKSDLIGRGKDRDFVMQWLRKPSDEDPTHIAGTTLYKNISLLSVVGHGGMGKTTLLQHVYADLKDEFHLKIWVCVSNDFDAKKVIADSLEYLKKERPRLQSLAAFQECLKSVVQSKRFLLILDDIWEEDMSKLENVLSPLACGSLGSKILVTTRMDSVAKIIAKVIRKKKETLTLKGLDKEECLKLLNTHAFADVEDLGAHKKLTNIAPLIVKKLSGSPLAAKVIGGVLNSNLNESYWMNILNNDIGYAEPELGHNVIMPILRLSYKFLPKTLQNCFIFCSIFPQDHQFDKDDLVRMWIALGFIQESFIEEETLEDVGGRYFDVLVRKSFFEKFEDVNKTYYKMHDLLNELALSVSSEECFRFVGDNDLSIKIPKTIRHLFVATENLEVLRIIKNFKNLHSLFLTCQRGNQDLFDILTEIFNASRSIRLLFICSPLLKMISEAIKNLRHLRYLKFTETNLTRMPRSLSNLYHLQFIIYGSGFSQYCSGDFLPSDMSNLSNLCHQKLPPNALARIPGIGKLRSLQELNEFNVKNENGYRIGELEHMSKLRILRINFHENMKDASEARTAKLCEKRKLTNLFLDWDKTIDEDSNMGFGSFQNIVYADLDVNVLENLRPYKNLKMLSIFAYKGARSAIWMYNAGLISNLEYISLDKCLEWETLPPFGQLPFLKFLYLCNMPKTKRLDNKLHGDDKVCVFPSLEVLHIKKLKVLKDWFDVGGAAEEDSFFPCLTELFLVDCPKLQELPYLPPKLKKMEIRNIGWKSLNCKQGTSSCSSISKSIPLEILEVRCCPNITSLLLADVRLEALRNLTIVHCPNLISLGGLQQVQTTENSQLILNEVVINDPSLLLTGSVASLERLRIHDNDVLVSFTVEEEQWFQQVSSSLGALSFLSLKSLKSLPSSLECLSSLKILRVYEVPQLQHLPNIPISVKELELENLQSLRCLPSSLSTISSLKHLRLSIIPLLESLPDLPPSLNSLSLSYLDNLDCLPSCLASLSSLLNISISNVPHLQLLPNIPISVEELWLVNLESLQHLPSSLSTISSLWYLRLISIPLLKSLPDLPPSLEILAIGNCHPEFMERYKKISGSDWHKIAHIPHVYILTSES